ncbi:MAG: hypothetical protein CMN30_05625 [Sandaracinus sp.]|nr:hypothetical protein [Sandaracinus sp.]
MAEPDPFQLELFQEACEAAGFDVAAALDGERALAQIARHPPSLVLISDALEAPPAAQVAAILRADEDLRTLPIVSIGPGVPDSDIHVDRPVRVERIESVLWRSLRRARDTRRRIRAESAPRLSLEIDRLTGAGTRGQLEITLHHELIHGARFRRSLGILRVRVADMESMPRVSRRMMKVLRDTDLVFRSETLELLAVLPETDIAEAAIVRDRLLAALEDGERVSWIGTAASEPHGTEVTPLLQRAGEPGH